MSRKNVRKEKKRNGHAFVKLIGDRRFLSVTVAVLAVAVVALTVLLILDSTGVLYRDGNGDGSGSVSSSAAERADGISRESGDYEYVLLKDGTAELSFYKNSKATSLTVPSSIDGYRVTSIGEECFTYMILLTEVTISEGITSISPLAFENCSQLVTLHLPSSLTTVADMAFIGCSSLSNVTYGGDLSSLGIGTANGTLKKALKLN